MPVPVLEEAVPVLSAARKQASNPGACALLPFDGLVRGVIVTRHSRRPAGRDPPGQGSVAPRIEAIKMPGLRATAVGTVGNDEASTALRRKPRSASMCGPRTAKHCRVPCTIRASRRANGDGHHRMAHAIHVPTTGTASRQRMTSAASLPATGGRIRGPQPMAPRTVWTQLRERSCDAERDRDALTNGFRSRTVSIDLFRTTTARRAAHHPHLQPARHDGMAEAGRESVPDPLKTDPPGPPGPRRLRPQATAG